jgi:hypothetical protein
VNKSLYRELGDRIVSHSGDPGAPHRDRRAVFVNTKKMSNLQNVN